MLKFNYHKKLTKETICSMNTVSQIARYRQSVLLFFFRNGLQITLNKFNVSRASLFRWKKRYDSSAQSLMDRSRRPHHHPNQHTEAELKLIRNMRRRNPNAGLVVFWIKLKERGYSRSVQSLWRVLKRLNAIPIKLPNPKYIPKPYEIIKFPGQKVQIDIKEVPAACIAGDARVMEEKFYQFTAIDEYSRFRYLCAFKDESSFSASEFVKKLVKAFPFPIECIQTDNGSEFTNKFTSKKGLPTLFQLTLKELGIKHKLIKPYTPRHNGKVERSHRKDNEYFYATHKFMSFEDFKKQLYVWNRKYNSFPMRPLHWLTPNQYIKDYLNLGLLYEP